MTGFFSRETRFMYWSATRELAECPSHLFTWPIEMPDREPYSVARVPQHVKTDKRVLRLLDSGPQSALRYLSGKGASVVVRWWGRES